MFCLSLTLCLNASFIWHKTKACRMSKRCLHIGRIRVGRRNERRPFNESEPIVKEFSRNMAGSQIAPNLSEKTENVDAALRD